MEERAVDRLMQQRVYIMNKYFSQILYIFIIKIYTDVKSIFKKLLFR